GKDLSATPCPDCADTCALHHKPTHRASAAGGYTNRLLRLSTTTSAAVRIGRPPVAGSVAGRTRRARNTDVGSCPTACSGSGLGPPWHDEPLAATPGRLLPCHLEAGQRAAAVEVRKRAPEPAVVVQLIGIEMRRAEQDAPGVERPTASLPRFHHCSTPWCRPHDRDQRVDGIALDAVVVDHDQTEPVPPR